MGNRTTSPQDVSARPLRVIIQQPSLAKYRVPVYRGLNERSDMEVELLYGDERGLENVPPEGFPATFVPLWEKTLCGQVVRWHRAQWQAAGRTDADVIVLSWSARYLSLIPALLRARWNRLPVILWGHGYSKRENWRRRLLRSIPVKLATALLFYDQRTADRAIASGMDPQRVFVAPNAIDQTPVQKARDHWLEDPERLPRFRREHDLEGRRVLLYVSRLDPKNRLDRLIDILPQLVERFPTLLVVVIGSGDPERERLGRLARDRGVESYVRFLGAIYDDMQLAPWFLTAELFVYPENVGLSLLHAFGYGLPVVTSNALAEQNPEIVALEDGVNGQLYEAGNNDDFREVLASLLEEESKRCRFAEAARHTSMGSYSMPRMVAGFATAIQSSSGRFRAASAGDCSHRTEHAR